MYFTFISTRQKLLGPLIKQIHVSVSFTSLDLRNVLTDSCRTHVSRRTFVRLDGKDKMFGLGYRPPSKQLPDCTCLKYIPIYVTFEKSNSVNSDLCRSPSYVDD